MARVDESSATSDFFAPFEVRVAFTDEVPRRRQAIKLLYFMFDLLLVMARRSTGKSGADVD